MQSPIGDKRLKAGEQPGDGESGLVYPCELDIKVFARAGQDLEQRIETILSGYLPTDRIIGVSLRESSKGNYHSLSCKILANDRQELDRVFSGLSGHPDILMVI